MHFPTHFILSLRREKLSLNNNSFETETNQNLQVYENYYLCIIRSPSSDRIALKEGNSSQQFPFRDIYERGRAEVLGPRAQGPKRAEKFQLFCIGRVRNLQRFLILLFYDKLQIFLSRKFLEDLLHYTSTFMLTWI